MSLLLVNSSLVSIIYIVHDAARNKFQNNKIAFIE